MTYASLRSAILLSLAAIAFLLPLTVFGGSALIPAPVKAAYSSGGFTVSRNTLIVSQPGTQCDSLASYLQKYLSTALGGKLRVEKARPEFVGVLTNDYITLSIDTTMRCPDGVRLRMPAEGYILRVTERGTDICGVDYAGLFYGIQTFLQLLPPEVYSLKAAGQTLRAGCAEISDWPYLGYRGMMLDCARTFVPFEDVLRFIDRFAYHKINRFHWHLSDDEGWRVEIKSCPEIAQNAGYRGPGLPVRPIYGAWEERYGGFYTQEQIRYAVRYAAVRNIEIIPEIELPGHSRAMALIHPEILCAGKPDISAAGYDRRNVWCASKESNYKLLEKILGEICDLFPSEYIHIGGDEVLKGQWLACPSCRLKARGNDINPVLDHFTSRVSAILAAHGKKPAVWNEAVASGKLTKNALVSGWENVKVNLESTSKGYKTVVMPGSYFYFDMKQSPVEPGMTWAGLVDLRRVYSFDFRKLGFTASHMANVAGIEASFFSELLLSNGMIPYLEYQYYPRVCALAEIAWSQPSHRDYDDFSNRLYPAHIRRLKSMGIAFRLPPPETAFEDGRIVAATHLDGAVIRYTDDGSQPGPASKVYSKPIKDYEIERYKFAAFIDGYQSPAVPVPMESRTTLEPGQAASVQIPLPEQPGKEGLWYLRIRSTEPDVNIVSMQVVSPDTSYYIIRSGQPVNEFHQIRFYASESTRKGNMVITLRNNNANLPVKLAFQFERSPYVEPKVRISSSLSQDRVFPFSRLTDYNFTSYARSSTTCKKGDHLTYTFDSPVDCLSIEVRTGLFYMPRFHIPAGRVEVSSDGIVFKEASVLSAGCATVYPDKPVKAVRVVSTINGNGESAVAFQDLKIIPRYK